MKRRTSNPFAGQSFGALSVAASKMIRGEYVLPAGADRHTHFMDLTHVLMVEHHDRSRDPLFCETIRGLVGRVQEAHGYGDAGLYLPRVRS